MSELRKILEKEDKEQNASGDWVKSGTFSVQSTLAKSAVHAGLLHVRTTMMEAIGDLPEDDPCLAALNEMIELTIPEKRGKVASAIDVPLLQRLSDKQGFGIGKGLTFTSAANWLASVYNNTHNNPALAINHVSVTELVKSKRLTMGGLEPKPKKTDKKEQVATLHLEQRVERPIFSTSKEK